MIKVHGSTARMTNADATHKPSVTVTEICSEQSKVAAAVFCQVVGLHCRPGKCTLCSRSFIFISATQCRLLAIRFSCIASASNHNKQYISFLKLFICCLKLIYSTRRMHFLIQNVWLWPKFIKKTVYVQISTYIQSMDSEWVSSTLSLLLHTHPPYWHIPTLSVVGVERSMSETARQTSRGRKIWAWCICDARKGCVFVQRRRKRWMSRLEGRSRCFGCGSIVAEKRSSGVAVGPSRRAHFRGVWSKTPNSSHHRLAIRYFQGNQYVTLSSTVLLRTIHFHQAVLPSSRALTQCTFAR